MAKRKIQKETMYPDKIILNKIQQKRFSMLTGLEEKEITGKSIAELSERLKLNIDPKLFFFKKICGKVVKKDPVTGVEYPVPFATVYAEDTDVNLITYSPSGSPWSWHFPLFFSKEVIGTAKTDACGNFCINIPYFDIDWILRWRKERICFPLLFERPHIIDIVTEYPPKPQPYPDPVPWEKLRNLSQGRLQSFGGSKIEALKEELSGIEDSLRLGKADTHAKQLLNSRAFDREVSPPLPAEFQKLLSEEKAHNLKKASGGNAMRSLLAKKLDLDPKSKLLDGFNLQRYIGPFYRCLDFYVPEWQMIVDVPDITFRVTQDTDGDGVEETIYSEGLFDVRWDSTSIPDITLVASPIAKESRVCNVPEVPCSNVPALQFAGLMPLNNTSYFNANTGYALRPNRPKLSDGTRVFPAETPFCRTLSFFGCVDVQDASYYRIQQSTDDGTTYAAITGLSWNNYISGGIPVPITADENGWYPVNPVHPVTSSQIPRASLGFPDLVFQWPTPGLQKTKLKIELGTHSKQHIGYSAEVAVQSDNTKPDIQFTTLSWKYADEPDSALRSLLDISCPMIKRGVTPKAIELVFEVSVAANHLRDAGLGTSGCGEGVFSPVTENNPSHWHNTVFDNSVTLYQRYALSAGSLPGCYSFTCRANSRSMNPSGADGGNLLPDDWFYDYVYNYTRRSIPIAVVNEDL